MERRGVLAVTFLAVVLVACGGGESATGTTAADVTSANSSNPTEEASEDDGDLVRVIGRVPALAGYEMSESGRPDFALTDGEADLRWRYARLAVSVCQVLDIRTQLSSRAVWYEAPGLRQTLYQPNRSYAALLIRDRLVIVSLHRICTEATPLAFTSDELMTIAEEIAATYWVEP